MKFIFLVKKSNYFRFFYWNIFWWLERNEIQVFDFPNNIFGPSSILARIFSRIFIDIRVRFVAHKFRRINEFQITANVTILRRQALNLFSMWNFSFSRQENRIVSDFCLLEHFLMIKKEQNSDFLFSQQYLRSQFNSGSHFFNNFYLLQEIED